MPNIAEFFCVHESYLSTAFRNYEHVFDAHEIRLLVRASTYLTNPKLRQEEILESDESCIGEEIPLLAEEGWTRHEENVPLPIWRGGGGQFGEIFRPEHFAKLPLRLRPTGLALRATPSAALRWLRDFLLMPQPTLLCEEGNTPACNSFTSS